MIGPTTDFPVLDIDELSVNYLAGVWPRWVIVRRASPADMYWVSNHFAIELGATW